MTGDFGAAATRAAGLVADALAARPFQAGADYDPRPVVAAAAEALASMRTAARAAEGPLVLGPDGRPDPFGVDAAGLMSFLQLVEVLYQGLETVPAVMATAAGRNLAATHRIARKVRERGVRLGWGR